MNELGKTSKSKRNKQPGQVRPSTSASTEGQARTVPTSRNNKKRNDRIFLFMIPVAIVVLLGLIFVLNKQGEKIKQDEMVNRPAVQFDLTGQPTLGSSEAKVSIVEFGDYKCPACKDWETTVFPQLKKDFIDTGKAKFSFINYPFIGNSYMASNAAEEVFLQKPEAFWPYHEAIYHAQGNEQDNWITTPLLLDLAKQVSPDIDLGKLEKAIDEQTHKDAISQDLKLKDLAKVSGTPSVYVNGKEFTGQWDSYSELKAFIEQALNEAK
ncbi:DsbA family protein [Paenibacillus alvei]|uniref:DsbA family protein n=1 Tax=Paenibacillus alvei TaxID=44250 RepID=UPI00228324FB|nr:DsbA family protein [Paenibacillus alvei]MCY9578118.1 DsbA family protein [Paenibacillus alvei]MCY9586596.1 DsbA family protein [Paenibacillus alvei]